MTIHTGRHSFASHLLRAEGIAEGDDKVRYFSHNIIGRSGRPDLFMEIRPVDNQLDHIQRLLKGQPDVTP